MTQAYLYRWTEIATGKLYVGSRYAKNCHPNDGYICTSRHVKPLIQSNPDGWMREILVVGTPTDIRDLEARYLVSLDAAKNPTFYNKTNGNKNFHTIGLPVSEAHIRRMKENNPSHRPEVKEKLRISGLGRDVSHLQSEESKLKKSRSQKLAWAEGKFQGVGFKFGDENLAKSPEVRAKISVALQNFKGARMTGKKHSSETKEKMAESRRLYWAKRKGLINV
jgi:hypothetical protein